MPQPLDLESVDAEWAWSAFEPDADSPWDESAAAHLYRRAGLGASTSQLKNAAASTPADVVAKLLDATEDASFARTANSLATSVLASGDAKRLATAWSYRLLGTSAPVREKTTLFWHGHFATGADKVSDPRLIWNQNSLLRKYALGNFGDLVQEIAKDPAMLIYLDSESNRKAHPNENFARELMELFCLGEGHYSETDVQELARCFTGWEIKNLRFRKNRYQQDRGTKSFLGQEGNFDGEQGVDIVLKQPMMPYFICQKLVRFYVCDEPSLKQDLLKPLCTQFLETGADIHAVLKTIFSSNLFYSSHARARKIKSPVDLAIGMLRSLEATANSVLLSTGMASVGQGLHYPPNVKGWDGGRAWINSATLLGRANLIEQILSSEDSRFSKSNLSDYVDQAGPERADAIVDWFCGLLLAVTPSQDVMRQLNAELDRTGKPREERLRNLLHMISTLPEFHLA